MNPKEPEMNYWQHLSHIEKLDKMIENELLVDCKFIVGPDNETAETIHGHKLLFSMASPVFEKMFSGNYAEAQQNSEIRINDAYPEDFKIFRSIIYKNCRLNLNKYSMGQTINLYRLGDKYMVPSILTQCISCLRFRYNPTTSDLITLFVFARELEDQTLLEVFKELINNTENPFDYKLNSLTLEAFYEYIEIISDEFNGYNIFSATNSYFESNNLQALLNMEDGEQEADLKTENSPNESAINKTQDLLKHILKLINFGHTSIKNFQDGPGKSNLLTSKQKYFILSALLMNKKYNNSACELIKDLIYIEN